MFADGEACPPEYYTGVAREFEAVASAIVRHAGGDDDLAERLMELAGEIRDGAEWLAAA
jgi:hypothetical protein